MENQNIIDSKFRMVILAAKRAKQLLRGARKRIAMDAENPLTIALEEINQGLIDFEITDGTPRKPDLSIFGDENEEASSADDESPQIAVADDGDGLESDAEAGTEGEQADDPATVDETREDADAEVEPAAE